MSERSDTTLGEALSARFSDAPRSASGEARFEALMAMAARGSCREFRNEKIPDEWIETICAVALSSPTKSDLQQRDIILIKSPETRQRLVELVGDQAWVAGAPVLAVICGNNRRQRLLHAWRGVAFANDHLDAFFNATGDAAIALGAFVAAAEALGLGCCPISAVRNEAGAVARLLGLPDHVFPFAGLAVGFPTAPPKISMRLPLGVTCHVDRYREDNLAQSMSDYSATRAASQPYAAQRYAEEFQSAEDYTWGEDKVRQYSKPERANFGRYVRACGFKLD